ncbi:erythromycin esterase family protein [Actinomycetospora sp. NBC_00405]|uniref:erythromycin esterase family protein n=1 Tax=Actinomycetospora sp. NBC_00405 TaxID=2975952 RepID=UPI002E225881
MVGLPASVRPLPADDPSALADLVGDAPVVAIGENDHGVREFGALRERLVRHLVRELGFGVVAVESGYAEGFLVDAWVRGGPGAVEDLARDGFTFRAGDAPEMQALVTGLREHREAGGRVRFAGLDIPGSGGSPEPALRLVREHLAAHASDAVPLVDAALEATRPYVAANNGAAPARYAALDAPARDAATAALVRLLLRVEALGPEHRVARHLALGALRLDEQLREFAELFAPDPPARVVSSRDVHMAETVRLLREETGERVVVLAHNGHVQRVPFAFMPGVSAPSAGTALAQAHGDGYVVVGLTALTGATPGFTLDDAERHGIALHTDPLADPEPGSVEQAVLDAGLGAEPVLLDLRAARGTPGPTSIRHATTHIPVDVLAGYDALYCLPRQEPAAHIT